MVIAILSAISFYLLPALLGRGLFLLTKKQKDRSFSLVNCFTAGSLVFFLLTFTSFYLFKFLGGVTFWVRVYPLFLKILAVLLLGFNLLFTTELSKGLRINWLVLVGLFFLAVISYGLWRLDTDYPLLLNWDFFHHQVLVDQIKKGQLSFLNSRMTDTFIFNGYSPLFHLLLAWPQWVFKPEFLAYFWWLDLVHLLMALGISFWLARQFLKTDLEALMATILAAFVFESFMVYGFLMLLPQTLVGVVFAYLVGKSVKARSFSLKKFWFSWLFLVLMHYMIGSAAVVSLILIFWLSAQRAKKIKRKTLNLLIILALVLLFVAPFLPIPINLDFLNRGEAIHFKHTIVEKIDFLRIFAGYFLFCFWGGGVILALFLKDFSLKIVALASLLLASLVALPLPYAFKFYVLTRFLINLLAAIAFLFLLNQLKSKFLRALVGIVFLLTAMTFFISSGGYIKNVLKKQNLTAELSFSELEAGQFLKEKYQNQEALLLSDPATQHILEPLSEINTQGGTYMNQETRDLLHRASQLSDPNEIKREVWQVKDELKPEKPEVLLFALSGRYFQWQTSKVEDKKKIFFSIWGPVDLSFNDLKYIDFLSQSEGFKKVFTNQTLSVFEVSPPT